MKALRSLSLVFGGQCVTLLGSETSKFALSLWAWQSTGKATTLTISLFCAYMPGILLGPMAGALSDRFDRKRVLVLCEAAGALTSGALLVLIMTKGLMVWQIYLVAALYSTIQAFKLPTLAASVPAMVSRNHYIRANSIHKFAESSASFLGPMLAALLLQMIGLRWIVIVDVISFVIAGLAIAAADLNSPGSDGAGPAARAGLVSDVKSGFQYLARHRGLQHLMLLFVGGNLTLALAIGLIIPAVMGRPGGSEHLASYVQASYGLGALIFSCALAFVDRFTKCVDVMLAAYFIEGAAMISFGYGSSAYNWIPSLFILGGMLQLVNVISQTIWQERVPPALQGRIFATKRTLAQLVIPIALLASGPLADAVFEPLFRNDPPRVLSAIFGSGPGVGIGVIFILSGCFKMAFATLASRSCDLRALQDAA